jgi:hypothetical protein
MSGEFTNLLPAIVLIGLFVFFYGVYSRRVRHAQLRTNALLDTQIALMDTQVKSTERQTVALERIATALESHTAPNSPSSAR